MTAYPVTALRGPQPGRTVSEQDGSAEAAGIATGIIADFDAPLDTARYFNADFLALQASAFVTGNEIIRPSVLAIPVAYDEAGVAYPSGSLLLLGQLGNQVGWVIMANTGTLTGSATMTMRKHFTKRWLVILGLPAATAGTVKIRRTSDWQAGAPSVDEITLAISGADGPEQWIALDSVSAPADLRRDITLYYVSSWSGTAPKREYLSLTAPVIAQGRICPDTLPAGYTQVTDPQEENFGAPLWQPNARWRARDRSCPSMSPLNRGFTRNTIPGGNGVSKPNSPTAYDDGLGMRFGQPGMLIKDTLPTESLPCIWVGAALKELAWMPMCSMLRTGALTAVTLTAAGVLGPYTITTAYSQLDAGPGWREISAWSFSASVPANITSATIELARTADWSAGAPTVTIATIAWLGTENDTSLLGTLKRLGAAITPAPDAFAAYLYVRLVLVGVNVASASVQVRASRRCDIAPPWPAAGPGGVIPGGYPAALLRDPENVALMVHGAAGDTVASFLHPGGGAWRNYVASFLPPTAGVWRGAYSVTPAQACTCGEYEQTVNRRTSHLGRAGKRFWACADQVLNGGVPRTDTLTLTAVSQVQTAVPSDATGLALNSGHATDNNWIFLTIGLPAAGSYRINLAGIPSGPTGFANAAIGPTALLAVSLTDPYVIDPDQRIVREFFPLIRVDSETATPPASPPSVMTRYLIATAATGAWAGEDGNIAQWDPSRNTWRFIRPDYAAYGFEMLQTTPAATRWRNPGDTGWSTGAGTIASLRVSVAAAQTLYVRVGKSDPDGVSASDSILTSQQGLASPRVWWETL